MPCLAALVLLPVANPERSDDQYYLVPSVWCNSGCFYQAGDGEVGALLFGPTCVLARHEQSFTHCGCLVGMCFGGTGGNGGCLPVACPCNQTYEYKEAAGKWAPVLPEGEGDSCKEGCERAWKGTNMFDAEQTADDGKCCGLHCSSASYLNSCAHFTGCKVGCSAENKVFVPTMCSCRIVPTSC